MFERLTRIPRCFYSTDEKNLGVARYLFLFLLCFAFFAPGFVTLPPTDRDESSFAQASKQMIETGNYTDIRLQDQPRYKKPIGIYWLQSAAVRILNPHHLGQIWAYRVPSFAGATIAVLMTAALGSLLFNPTTGLLAAMMMAGCVLLNVEARLAKTDAALLACVMIAQYGLARAYVGGTKEQGLGTSKNLSSLVPSPYSLVPPFLFWTALAAGILIKGPIILLPVVGTLLWLKISDKNIAWFGALRPALGIPYALALIAPWFVAISLQSHGAFMQASAGQDMFAKLWQGQNRGILPPGMHLMAMPLVFFPFCLYVVFALPDMWKGRRDDAFKFLLGWAVPTWCVFELSLTKLPHYVLPAYPAIALMTAKIMLDGFPTVANTTRRLPVALIVGMWLMIGSGFAFVFILLPAVTDNVWMKPQIAAGLALVVAQAAALLILPQHKIASIQALTIGSLIFMAVTFGSTLPSLQHIWMSRAIVSAVDKSAPCPHAQIIATGYHEPSLVFLGGTDTIMAANGGEAAKALQQDRCRVAVIDNKNKQEFIDTFANAAPQPMQVDTIEGLNSGHGAETALTLYRLSPP